MQHSSLPADDAFRDTSGTPAPGDGSPPSSNAYSGGSSALSSGSSHGVRSLSLPKFLSGGGGDKHSPSSASSGGGSNSSRGWLFGGRASTDSTPTASGGDPSSPFAPSSGSSLDSHRRWTGAAPAAVPATHSGRRRWSFGRRGSHGGGSDAQPTPQHTDPVPDQDRPRGVSAPQQLPAEQHPPGMRRHLWHSESDAGLQHDTLDSCFEPGDQSVQGTCCTSLSVPRSCRRPAPPTCRDAHDRFEAFPRLTSVCSVRPQTPGRLWSRRVPTASALC